MKRVEIHSTAAPRCLMVAALAAAVAADLDAQVRPGPIGPATGTPPTTVWARADFESVDVGWRCVTGATRYTVIARPAGASPVVAGVTDGTCRDVSATDLNRMMEIRFTIVSGQPPPPPEPGPTATRYPVKSIRQALAVRGADVTYVVQAHYPDRQYGESGPVTVFMPFAAPTDFRALAYPSSVVRLSWSAVDGAFGQTVNQAIDRGVNEVVNAAVDGASSAHRDTTAGASAQTGDVARSEAREGPPSGTQGTAGAKADEQGGQLPKGAERERIRQWRPMETLPHVYQDDDARRTPAQERQVLARLSRITDVFRRAAPLNPPRGFDVQPVRTFTPARPGVPVRALLTLRHLVFLDEDHTEIEGRVHVTVNDPFATYHWRTVYPLFTDSAGPIYRHWPDRQVASVGGFPVYARPDSGKGEGGAHGPRYVVVAREPMPLWVTVSVERYVRGLITAERDSLRVRAERRANGHVSPEFHPQEIAKDARRADALRALERRFARMSSAERAAPAYVPGPPADETPPGPDYLVSQTSPGAAPIFAPNPALMAGPGPSTAFRVLVVEFDASGLGRHYKWEVMDALRRSVDWAALRALLQS